MDGVVAAAPVAGGALHRVDDDVGEQALLGQRRQRRARSRSGSSRASRPARPRAALAVELGQPVDAAPEQVGGAVLAVPALVGRRRSRSRKSAERSTTRTPVPAQGGDGRRRGAVRVGDDRRVDALEPGRGRARSAPAAPGSAGRARRAACRRRCARSTATSSQPRVAPDDLRRQGAGEAGGAGDQDPRRGLAVERLCVEAQLTERPSDLAPARPRSRSRRPATSSSVRVRSGARNSSRRARLLRPSPSCSPS